MRKIHFPFLLAAGLLLVIGSGFFFYLQQRNRHIDSELQKLKEGAQVAASSIFNEMEQLQKEFLFLDQLKHLNDFFYQPLPIPAYINSSIERLFARYPRTLKSINVFDHEGNCRSSFSSVAGSFIISSGTRKLPENFPKQTGVYQDNNSKILRFLVKTPSSQNLGIFCDLDIESLISNNLVSIGKLKQSFRQLLLNDRGSPIDSISFQCFNSSLPSTIKIFPKPDFLIAVNESRQEISTVLFEHQNNRLKFFIINSPLTFRNQQLNLVLMLFYDDVLELVNSNHFIVMIFFAFALIFSLMLIILKLTTSTQKAIAEELSTQSNLFSLIINSMPIGVAVKDVKDDYRYIICNLAAARIFNRHVDQIIGKTDQEIFPEDISEDFKQQDIRLEKFHEVEIVEKELANYGAGGLWLRTTRLPMFSPDGDVSMLMRVVEDITSSVKLESQLHHSQRMDEIGKLAGGIAHEFNNFLQVILGYCEFIKSETDNENTLTNLDQIEKAGQSAMRLTRQLLTYSRKTEMKKEPIELSKAVAEGLRMLTRFIGDGIEINFSEAPEKIDVLADASQIEQILVNLCVNARDAMNGKGIIKIAVNRVTEVQQAINMGIRRNMQMPFGHIRVEDNGPGIPENLRERVFEPFFTTKEVGKGTGLGLAIIYAILKQHEGYIFLDQTFSSGTAFDIYFPVNLDALEEETEKTSAVEVKGFDASKYLLLVAEDEDAVRQMCIKLLHKNGFNTIEATNGEEAVELFKQHKDKISMLVFDVMMPKMTGKAAYDEIAQIAPDIPIIFCSGYSDENLKAELTSRPKAALLDKPYKTNRLIETIKKFLSE